MSGDSREAAGDASVPELPFGREPGFEDVYALPDLEAAGMAFRRSRHGRWLALARGLAEALGHAAPLEPSVRPEIEPVSLPAATVFLLAATDRTPPGCLGHVAARPATWSLGMPGAGESSSRIADGADLVEAVVGRVVSSVRTLSPDAIRPETSVSVPFAGAGDSHGVAVAIASMHAMLRARVPFGLAATGGFDEASGRFTPVPLETLPAKLAAAERWRVRTLVVVEGQVLPEAMPHGLRVIRMSPDPGALPLLVLELADLVTTQSPSGAAEADSRRAWQQALALYDLRVATGLEEPVDSVLAKTAPFVEPVVSGLEATRMPSKDAVRAAFEATTSDPLVVGLAADIRSRALLHAGRSVEAAWWDAVSVGLRGLGDLPDGMLGDHMLYRQPAHRSILAIDLGDLDDPDDRGASNTGGGHPHAVLDSAIRDLEGRWCTRHQALFAIFASNTRWRRRLYLARRDLDLGRFEQAASDLLRWRHRWEDLLEVHARHGLGMGNTDLARQWNAVLEHAVTEVSLRDPEGFSTGGGEDGLRRGIASRWIEDDLLLRDLEDRHAAIDTLSAFDLRGLLQWLWLQGEQPLPEVVVTRCRVVLGETEKHPVSAVRGVAEWWWRLPGLADADRQLVLGVLRGSLDAELVGGTHADGGRATGVHRIVGLRRARILDLEGLDGPPKRSWVDSVARPDGPGSLQQAFDDLRSQPESLLVRVPY